MTNPFSLFIIIIEENYFQKFLIDKKIAKESFYSHTKRTQVVLVECQAKRKQNKENTITTTAKTHCTLIFLNKQTNVNTHVCICAMRI